MNNVKDTSSIKVKIFNGLFWKFMERVSAQGISFVLSIILARILMPEDYGVIAFVMVFINIANVFISNGLGESLIQKTTADDKDFSTVFYCSIIISLILYTIIYLASPLIANFYGNNNLIMIVRILSFKLILSSINTVQHAYVAKNMIFKKFFFSTIGGTILSGIIGIALAYNGFGVWALVAQYLINSTVDTVILFITVPWKPRFLFSLNSAKELIGFGWKLTVASLINEFYNQLRSLVIGKKYTSSDLAFYNRGNNFPSLIITNIDTSISSVMFPAMSKSNYSVEKVKELTKKSLRLTSFIIFPLMAGMVATSKQIVLILLTDKWIECVPYLQYACIYYATQPIQTANWQAIKSLGRSDICLKYELIKKIIGIALIIISMNISVDAIGVTNAIMGIIMMLINMIPNVKLLNYGFKEQFKDFSSTIFASIIMGILVYIIGYMNINIYAVLFSQIVVGIIIYLSMVKILKVEEYYYIIKIVEKIKKNKKQNLTTVLNK